MKKSPKAGRPVRRIPKKQTAKSGDLAPVFCALRSLLQPYQGQLVAQTDQPTHFSLESKTPTLRSRPMYFAGVRQGKNYVSYYLMSVPACPELVR